MDFQPSFLIYNAAAGAGKTYTLVKSYLINLLQSPHQEGYQNILAVTFTNKAVAEMKERILQALVLLSRNDKELSTTLLQDIIRETGMNREVIQKKAARILQSILHNYAAFDIVTIDRFTHRIIRTFAKDLGISFNFEVELDTDSIVQEAVDNVIDKIGIDSSLTKTIIDFALLKLSEDKSWDISRELNAIAKLLIKENEKKHLQHLDDKENEDFEQLKVTLKKRIQQINEKNAAAVQQFFDLLEKNSLQPEDFTRQSIPKHFEKIRSEDYANVLASAKWKDEIETTSFYTKSLSPEKKELIDAVRKDIIELFISTKHQVYTLRFLQNIRKNLVPLSVLSLIKKEVDTLQKEKNIILISEFNSIISTAIQDQPAPFIYERLGEHYKSYYIDEFQDTSALQWKNMIPLIDNSLASGTGQLTIVGDAKQAIYRWRGGEAEQFINLSQRNSPFLLEEKYIDVVDLPVNYRSYHEIIQFNNTFFTFLAQDLQDVDYQNLYKKGNQQKPTSKKGGYVEISFVDAKISAEEAILYPQEVLRIVSNLIRKEYRYRDICVLIRAKKQGAQIAAFLSENGIPIISSESLLLHTNETVCFIIDVLKVSVDIKDLLSKAQLAYFLAKRFKISDTHVFIKELVSTHPEKLVSFLSNYNLSFDFREISNKPLYQSVEYIIAAFNLGKESPAYLQYFLDVIFEYGRKYAEGAIGFLAYWKKKKDSLSIVAADTENAVRIMTIHKSKGLEFPCVIYAYAHTKLYDERDPTIWLPVASADFGGFDEVLVSFKEELALIDKTSEYLVHQRKSQQELDAFNLFYVACTRAEEQLYIVSKTDLTKEKVGKPHTFSGKLINYLQHLQIWDAEKNVYTFGDSKKISSIDNNEDNTTGAKMISSFESLSRRQTPSIITTSGILWDTPQEEAIEEGNLVHNLLSNVKTSNDVDIALLEAIQRGWILEKEMSYYSIILKTIIDHPEIVPYFENGLTVYNEKDIFFNGAVYRPDRLVFTAAKKCTIIDYKTGSYISKHIDQLQRYAAALESMGYLIERKIIIYTNEPIHLKYV